MDFGLAKTQDFEAITDAGMVAGSPSYISPEIWHGEQFDHRVDVYSFGAVIYRTLAGEPPFVAPSTLKLYETATTAPRPRLTDFRPELSPAIDTWVQRALAIRADQRYPDIGALWQEFLNAITQSETPSIRRYKHLYRP
jgi:serine/threonine-protein kinase